MKHKPDSRATVKNEIVAGILVDRDLDAPVTVYDELNSDIIVRVLKSLMALGPIELINKYNRNAGVEMVFSYMTLIHI